MKKHIFFAGIIIILSVYLLITHLQTIMTITYFPIDYNRMFNYTTTSLTALDDNVTVDWTSRSESDAQNYLRHDVSLLFKNGKLNGVQNKWLQNQTVIEQYKRFTVKSNSLLQAITFHHGELHENDTIYSIQHMSEDSLYIIKHQSFRTPENDKEKTLVNKLNKQIDQNVHSRWDELITFFNVKRENYLLFPLIEITKLNDYLMEQYSHKESDKIIGQLWEGLYKNYILQAVELKSNDYMPIILLAKDHSHLLVLYEMDDEANQLIQRIHINQ